MTGLGIAQLLLELRTPERARRLDAAEGLGLLGPQARGAVPALAEALRDADGAVRRMAAAALGDIGPHARSAAPALIAALGDAQPGVRRRAVLALVEVGAAEALPALSRARTDVDPG